MPYNSKKISIPIREEMRVFEKKFREVMSSKVPLLDKIMHFIIRRKGKQMRPMLVFLSAKMFGEINEKTYRAACLVEILHTATLIHDDVIDNSNMRRGCFSINSLWKNKIAILVGDYLLSKGLVTAIDFKDYEILGFISKAVKDMSEGELLQMDKSKRFDTSEGTYYDVIKQKTASLISACCAMGASSARCNETDLEKIKLFGEYVGIAFQMKDDLFDYKKTGITGKPIGIDIKEQKMTLPLIYTLNNCEKDKRKWLSDIIKKHNKDKNKVNQAIEFIKGNGGVEYTISKMEEYRDKSLKILNQFDKNDSRDSLELMVNYVIERSH
ncbi:polyprenyl synthetase family protein [Ichthyobacterium seriolicida]|uniref:Polyprenyl synthetase n=1 Tax=Ichthyobacterium seriolicida TaxID=242600 RepID=A0A1J1E4H5_9FLAO|nr:polyprenyl synthetase family protein [Ichthyobacterium seriolicida]BAV94222.1 polyprenyl synthetase [Ichthyobacterium seriolicida]